MQSKDPYKGEYRVLLFTKSEDKTENKKQANFIYSIYIDWDIMFSGIIICCKYDGWDGDWFWLRKDSKFNNNVMQSCDIGMFRIWYWIFLHNWLFYNRKIYDKWFWIDEYNWNK